MNCLGSLAAGMSVKIFRLLDRIKGPPEATAIRRDTFKVNKTETLANNQAKSMTNPALDN